MDGPCKDAQTTLLAIQCDCPGKQTVSPGPRSARILAPIFNDEKNPILSEKRQLFNGERILKNGKMVFGLNRDRQTKKHKSRSGSSPYLPKSPLSETKLWSRYHKGCVKTERTDDRHLNDVNVEKCDKRHKRLARAKPLHKMDDENEVTMYLDQNKDFLETYVMENIPVSELQKWLVRKMAREPETANKKYNRFYTREEFRTDPKKYVLMELIQKLGENVSELALSWEIARYICSSIGYDAYRVYKIFPDHPNFVQYFVTETMEDLKFPSRMIKAEPGEISVVLEVAESGKSLRLSKSDEGFPSLPQSLLKTFGKDFSEQVNHIMYIPILTAKEKTAYVIEIWRIKEGFDDKDKELSSNLIVWGSLALHYCILYLDKTKERSMTDFLLEVVKAIFEEMVSLDQLIKRILEFAQKLVNADRSSLFLVDYRNFELVSTVFDLKFEPGQGRDMEKKEIRMPINRGIAGHVALSGETMNIPDAYLDYRFNREVDEATGYKTISILCMPVKVQGKVIGVVQMVNKRNNDNFNHEDEVAFEIFSTFFGLALHHARLYDKIMRKEQKYRVAIEVLSYHNTCREHEVEEILKEDGKFLGNINNFYLDPYKLDDFQKCKAVISMFDDLFDLSRFNVLSLTRFILTVKKNYRSVPYHNFDHGWSVAQAMYAIIKHDTKKRFDYKMRLALFVACLCHDLDHRGYTNKYMNEIASPLAAMYTTSPLEHHHFNITVTILQQDGHNIFSHLSSEDYKDILRYIRHCILATDLAAFFPNLVKLKNMFNNERRRDKFNWLNPGHRDLAMAISMTSADLSAAAKPWEIQIKTVKVIFEEFYDQGDKERAAGKIPIPMMDRSKPEEQPASQVGFLSQICIPCYTMLSKIIPKTKPMYKMVLKNLNIWKSKAICALEDTKGSSSSDDVSDIQTESEVETDDFENKLSDKNSVDLKESIESKNNEDEFDDCDDLEEIEKITSEMETNWKCIKSDSVSWDEDQGLDDSTKINCENVWRGIGNTWVDDEGVVTRSNKALKIMIMDSENNEKPKT